MPRWYGDTIGFWDKDVLITWTSNIQGWKSHSEFEFSNKMQSIEIYTPIRKDGKFVGLNHEAILYDADALVEPIRIVRNFLKINDFTDDERRRRIRSSNACRRSSPSTARTSRSRRAPSSSTRCPDMYGRPWAKIWEENFEQGMSKPDVNEDLFNFDKK